MQHNQDQIYGEFPTSHIPSGVYKLMYIDKLAFINDLLHIIIAKPYLLYYNGEPNNIEPRSSLRDVVQDDKSNLLILLSSDRTMPMNTVCLNLLWDVFIEFNEVNISVHISAWDQRFNEGLWAKMFTSLNSKKILQYIETNSICGHCSIRR